MNEKYGRRAVLEFSSVKDELLHIRREKYGQSRPVLKSCAR
jgi:hypothetical protein